MKTKTRKSSAKPAPIPKLAVQYIRVSSTRQQDEGYSLPAQERLMRDYASRLGLIVPPENQYVEAESAGKKGRKKFDEMVAFLKAHPEVKILLCEKEDRLYRNWNDYVTLDDLAIDIHFVMDGVVIGPNSSDDLKMITEIKVSVAKRFLANLRRETKKGLKEKAEQGFWPSVAPLGYLNVQAGDRRFIEPDPASAPIVSRMFEWYAGGLSVEAVTKKAFEEGLRTRPGKKRAGGGPVGETSVNHMLSNPLYTGEYVWNGKVIQGLHRPLVTKKLFQVVQDVMAGKVRAQSRVVQRMWPFKGIMKCGYCGCAMVAGSHRDKWAEYIYYNCTKNKGACSNRSVAEKDLAPQFAEAIRRIQLTPPALQVLIDGLRATHETELRFREEANSAMNTQLQVLEKRIDAMFVHLLDGRVDGDVYDRKLAEYRAEKSKLEEQLKAHGEADQGLIDEAANLLKLAQRSVNIYELANSEDKNALLRFLCLKVTCKDKVIEVEYKKPFCWLVDMNDRLLITDSENEPPEGGPQSGKADWANWEQTF